MLQNLTISEFIRADRNIEQTVIYVAKHKTSDMQPATLVVDDKTMDWLDRLE